MREFQWPEETVGSSRSRADQILDAFEKFHFANPGVWNLFKQFTFQAIRSGRERYSSDCVCHRIRWHTAIETGGEEVKINDHYTAYYSRLFHIAFPEHAGFFSIRKMLSQDEAAYANDLKVCNTGPCDAEADLLTRLAVILHKTPQ